MKSPLGLCVYVCMSECIGRQQTYEDGGRIIQRVCVFGMRETKPLNEEAVPNAERNRQHEGEKKKIKKNRRL